MSEANYILGQVIARGGMAEVYRGLQVGQDGFKRIVAIKRILPQYAGNKEFSDMFRDEAHIGQRLQHANVVKVECFSIIDKSPAIVMEFVDGSDLRSLLAELERSKAVRRMSVPMILYVIAEAARGLHYAHTRKDDISGRPLGLVHRDISPQNILVSYNGEVKVTDFGIASADQDFKKTETKAGIVKGKYSYMSPEQISAKKVDARTDIFALSIVMWEMLAMKRLFSAENEVEVIDLVKNCRIPGKLRDYSPDVSTEVDGLVLKGLSKDPGQRFASMDEFERCLRSVLSKSYPNFTVNDLATLIKQTLLIKHEESQLEIKKMLSSASLKAAGKSGGSLEVDVGTDEVKPKFVVSRLPMAISQSQTTTRQGLPPNHQKLSGISRNHFSNAQPKKVERSTVPRRSLQYAATFVLIVLISVLFKVQTNAAKDSVTIDLKSTPSSVKIRLNGSSLKGNKYIKTPATLRLEPGPNILEVSRAGYLTETITIDTAKGEHTDVLPILLKPRGSFVPIRIALVSKDQEAVYLNVNDNFAGTVLSQKKPFVDLRDTSDGQELEISATVRNMTPFKCKAVVRRGPDQTDPMILLDTDKMRCFLSNKPTANIR